MLIQRLSALRLGVLVFGAFAPVLPSQLVAQAAPVPSFEVASIRPCPPDADLQSGHWSFPGIGRFNADTVSLATLLGLAYDIDDSQILNKPDWLETAAFTVDARPEPGVKLSREELRPRLQLLLHNRFGLESHTETRSVRGFALVVGKGGAHLTPTPANTDKFPNFRKDTSPGHMMVLNCTLAQLAKDVTPPAGGPVQDRTGLAGSYDMSFVFNPEPGADSALPLFGPALERATGLTLKAARVPVEFLVIDAVHRTPTEN